MTPPPKELESLLARATPGPWVVKGGALRTADDQYLAESFGAWSSPRGADERDASLELASLAPTLAAEVLRLTAALRNARRIIATETLNPDALAEIDRALQPNRG